MNKYPIFGYAKKKLNILTGCTKNCEYCWARKFAYRLKGKFGYPADNPFAPTFHSERLVEPGKWLKPQIVACNFMGDWMDYNMNWLWVDEFLKVVVRHPQHTFLTLTKQPKKLRSYLSGWRPGDSGRPYNNLWYGLTITNQADADEKLPIFLQIPGKKWLSIEPCTESIDLGRWFDMRASYDFYPPGYIQQAIDQVIIGGMSGPKANDYPLKLEWVRQIIDDCRAAGVPCFVKQLHIYKEVDGKVIVSKEPGEWPGEFRVRQLAWGRE